MKPVDLVARAIKNSSKANEIVADFFGGSGTTLIAADQLQRVAILAEIDPKYCDVIVERYIQHKGLSDDVFLLRDGNKVSYREAVADADE